MSVSATRARTGSVTKRVRKDGTTAYGVRYWSAANHSRGGNSNAPAPVSAPPRRACST